MPSRGDAVAPGLDAHDPHARILDKGPEEADGVRAAADAGHHEVGELSSELPRLRPRFLADDAVEVAHHHRVRVRSQRRAQQVVGRPYVGHPVPERLVDGVFERLRAALDGNDGGAQQLHPEDVERLARNVHAAHVHLALEAEERRRGRRGDPVLAGACLRDDPALAHALGEERLAQHVVDLVRARVAEIFSLEEDLCSPAVLSEPLREVQRRRAPGVARQEPTQAAREALVPHRRPVGLLELDERGHERLGNEAPTEAAEVAGRVGQRGGVGSARAHALSRDADLAAATKRRTLSGSFVPGLASTPEFTSTPYGFTMAIDWATFSGVRPPDRIRRGRGR